MGLEGSLEDDCALGEAVVAGDEDGGGDGYGRGLRLEMGWHCIWVWS